MYADAEYNTFSLGVLVVVVLIRTGTTAHSAKVHSFLLPDIISTTLTFTKADATDLAYVEGLTSYQYIFFSAIK